MRGTTTTTGQSREARLQDFVDWSAAHITGDEKGQAQIFLDRLFQAFGQRGSLDVGGSPEMRIRKAKEDGGGTSFADYVWKPVVLIEMKKRGADLSRHYRQAFDYWTRLVPDRPRHVVLCNFDEFWVYDFNNQLDSPKDKVRLTELSTRWGPLAFLFATNVSLSATAPLFLPGPAPNYLTCLHHCLNDNNTCVKSSSDGRAPL